MQWSWEHTNAQMLFGMSDTSELQQPGETLEQLMETLSNCVILWADHVLSPALKYNPQPFSLKKQNSKAFTLYVVILFLCLKHYREYLVGKEKFKQGIVLQ